MSRRGGWMLAAATFALAISIARPAAAGRAASTRSDGPVSHGGTASGTATGGSSGPSSSSGSSSSGSSSSSSGGGWSDSGRHAVPRDGGVSSKPARDDGEPRTGPSNDEGRTAVGSPGGGELGRREPHRGGGGGRHGGHSGGRVFVGGGWWDPWYYDYGWGWGWRGWWWPWGPASVMYDRPYHSGRGSGYGALDLDVWPGDAEIYVDGERVGTADDFDGFPTYLWLPRGTYDVVIYLPGFTTIARQYSIYDGLVIDVEDRMQRGEAVRPEDLPSRSTVNRDERQRRNEEREDAVRRHDEWRQRKAERDEAGDGREAPAPPDLGVPDRAVGTPDRDTGTAARLHLTVSPNDASIYLDGNFLGTASELEQLSAGLVVSPGSHRLEVVRPGYQAEERDFSSSAGEDVQLQVDLDED